MDPGDWIAGYAAVVATLALIWQLITYLRARVAKLTLKVDSYVLAVSDESARAIGDFLSGKDGEFPDIEWYFDFRIVNYGRNKVQISSIHMSQASSHGMLGWDAGKRAGLPLWLEPGEERSFRFMNDDLENAIVTKKIHVSVRVSTGKSFEVSSDLLGPKTLVITPKKMFDSMEAKIGARDRTFILEVQELDEE